MSAQQSKPRLAVVTGAAGGIGSATATQFCAGGWSLMLCDLDAGRLETGAGPLQATGCHVEILAGDVSDPAFPPRLVAALGDRQIDALVHAAGVSPTMADAARILEVNYDASARLVEAVRPKMAEQGCAVLIASSAAHMVSSPEIDLALNAMKTGDSAASLLSFGSRPDIAYPLSKRAVIRLVAREAAAFGKRKARIASISPGLIDTSMSRAEQAASSQMAALLAKTPLERFGVADEIASVAVFLCSPGASYVSGCDIRVDGGMLAAMGC
jgi:NAD(P)-dependent dehydrogenase (short-subunit alcohol dehydrogenase family)